MFSFVTILGESSTVNGGRDDKHVCRTCSHHCSLYFNYCARTEHGIIMETCIYLDQCRIAKGAKQELSVQFVGFYFMI